jgi:uncharacterized protein YndB with AHSA1/START domain
MRPPAATSPTTKKQITIERTLKAGVDRVWKMWTTKEGIEKWWGPEGFTTVVRHLDVRVGGHFEVVMTATVPEIIAHLKAGGMDASSVSRGHYTEVEVNRRLAYDNVVDFIPGVAPYTAATTVDLYPTEGGGTRMVVCNDVMHDAMWTERARMGWEQEIGKLERVLT